MTDNEIIKALEHCCDEESECRKCPFNKKCEKDGERLITYALDLIERQQTRISEWVKECEELQERLIDCEKTVAKQIFAEIKKIIDEKYNRDVFRSEYDDTEVEAIINFSDSISIEIYDLKEKYIGSEEQL